MTDKDSIAQRLLRLGREIEKTENRLSDLRRDRDAAIFEALDAGWMATDIAELARVSRGRVSQLAAIDARLAEPADLQRLAAEFDGADAGPTRTQRRSKERDGDAPAGTGASDRRSLGHRGD